MKRLFFFNGNHLIAYEWEKNQFKNKQKFAHTEDDREKFHLYLRKHPNIPARILVDVIEEEFGKESLPYVTGSDRQALFKRTKEKRFRAQKYRYIELQGRQETGRKDLNVILSALLNPETLEWFLDIIEENQIPVEGIYSLPIVGELLLPTILANKGSTLLVSNQGSSTLRQSYYINGRLAQSRLSSMDDERDMEFITLLENEIDSTLRFLVSTRIFKRDEGINIFIIVPDYSESLVRDKLTHVDNAQYSILATSKVFNKIGIKGKPISEYSDILYAHLLLEKRYYKNQYAPIKQRSRYYHLLIEKALYIISAVILIISLLFLIIEAVDWSDKEEKITQIDSSKTIVQRQLNLKQKEIVTYSYSATTTKEVVELYEKIKAKVHNQPKQLFSILSAALTKNPNIVLLDLIWQYTNNPNSVITNRVDGVLAEPINFTKKDFIVVKVSGKVISFEDNYRRAIQYHKQFIKDLEQVQSIETIEEIESPFNLNSSASVEGDSGTSAQVKRKAKASFSLKIKIKVE